MHVAGPRNASILNGLSSLFMPPLYLILRWQVVGGCATQGSRTYLPWSSFCFRIFYQTRANTSITLKGMMKITVSTNRIMGMAGCKCDWCVAPLFPSCCCGTVCLSRSHRSSSSKFQVIYYFTATLYVTVHCTGYTLVLVQICPGHLAASPAAVQGYT